MTNKPQPVGRRLLRLLEQARTPVFAIGPRGRLAYANGAWVELTGCAIEEAVGRPTDPTPDPTDRVAPVLSAFDPPPEARAGHPASARVAVPREGGHLDWCRVDYWPLADPNGRHTLILGLVGPDDRPGLAPESPNAKLRADLLELRAGLTRTSGSALLIGRGPIHRRLVAQVGAVAVSGANVVLIGPPGSGRRHVTEAIHQARAPAQTRILVDCSAFPPDRFADHLRESLAVAASLVLLDLPALPRDAQSDLIQWLDRATEPRPQLLSICGTDPDQAVAAGTLRPDLLLTLSTLTMRLPPLTERLEDLALLARHFLEAANRDQPGDTRRGFAPGALEVLAAYHWPGNLAELRRVVQSAHHAAEGDLIRPGDWPAEIRGQLGSAYPPPPLAEPTLELQPSLDAHERRLILRALDQCRRNKTRAAELLGLSRAKLIRRIRDLGLDEQPG